MTLSAVIIEYKGGRMAKRRKRHAPCDPAEAARRAAENRRNPGAWGVNDDALKLDSNADVSDQAETRNKVRRVTRFDIFHLLHARNELEPGQLNAIRRLQEDIAILHRTAGTAGPSTPIRTASQSDAFALSRLKAGERVDSARQRTGAHSWRILEALCEPLIVEGRLNNWRAVVQRVTGEEYHMAQSALVKAAAYNLAGAYEAIDGMRKRA